MVQHDVPELGLPGEHLPGEQESRSPHGYMRLVFLPDNSIVEVYRWAGEPEGYNIWHNGKAVGAAEEPLTVKMIVLDIINKVTHGGNGA